MVEMFQVALTVGFVMMLSAFYILAVWAYGRRRTPGKGRRGGRVYYRG